MAACVSSCGSNGGGDGSGGGWPDSGGDDATIDGAGPGDAAAEAMNGADAAGPDASPDAQPPPPATLADWWAGHARWKLVRTYTLANTGWPYGYGAGAHITIANGVWYLFSRRIDGSVPPYCQSQMTTTLSTEVRASMDEGVTWSAPVTIIPATPNTPWECAATDGDAYYDATTTTWHYLFQCLDRNAAWRGCELSRQVADPMGAFSATHANPVIQPGALWNQICNDASTDECAQIPGGPGRVHDEGTFNVFARDSSGYYFVGFHGFDGTNGYRGIAKTPDFVTWIAGDPAQGVPSDAIHDKEDAVGWRESWQSGGPIGGGAGSILYENGEWYSIVETGDISLGCIDGQDWDWGASRSPSLMQSEWTPLPAGNPFLYSSKLQERNGKSIACNPAYSRLFRDPSGTVWLHTTRESVDPRYAGIYLYRLVADDSLLDNGDLWKCDGEGWQKFPLGPTNLAVYRDPNGSSDGNCYLATNCGQSTCQAGQSIYQDVKVSGVGGKALSFGGMFATDSGTGSFDLAVLELDAQSNIVATHIVHVTAGTTYAPAAGSGTLDAKTATLRYQIYLDDPLTFRCDEMHLSVR